MQERSHWFSDSQSCDFRALLKTKDVKADEQKDVECWQLVENHKTLHTGCEHGVVWYSRKESHNYVTALKTNKCLAMKRHNYAKQKLAQQFKPKQRTDQTNFPTSANNVSFPRRVLNANFDVSATMSSAALFWHVPFHELFDFAKEPRDAAFHVLYSLLNLQSDHSIIISRALWNMFHFLTNSVFSVLNFLDCVLIT